MQWFSKWIHKKANQTFLRGTIGQILVIAIVMPLIFATVGAFPAGANFLVNLFWESIGEIEIFDGAATALSGFMENSKAEMDATISSLLLILAKAFFQTMILGACVYVITTKVAVNGAPILTSVGGFVIGLILVAAVESFDANQTKGILYAVACIALLVYGCLLTLGVKKPGKGKLGEALVPFLLEMLLGALFSAAVAGAVTALMVAPSLVHAGKSALAAIGWYLLMTAFMLIMVFIFYISRDEKK